MKNTIRQLQLLRLVDSIPIQNEPLHYNGYALDIKMIHRGIVRDLSILPIDQHEACLEDLASLISIAEQFCLNHPLHYEITPPQIYQEFFLLSHLVVLVLLCSCHTSHLSTKY